MGERRGRMVRGKLNLRYIVSTYVNVIMNPSLQLLYANFKNSQHGDSIIAMYVIHVLSSNSYNI
jgi:hypothetical protein